MATTKKLSAHALAKQQAAAKQQNNNIADNQGDGGQAAAYNGLGQDALQGGEYVANKYVPGGNLNDQKVAQIDTSRSAETQNSLNQLNANVGNSADTENSLALQKGYSTRSQEQQDVLNRQNDIAKNGMNSQEFQGLREQMNQGIGSAYQTGQANLAKAQARGKVYGAAGAAQQANLVAGSEAARMNNEQQLYIKGQDVRRTGLNDYSNTLNTQNQQLATNANTYGQTAQTAQQGQQARGVAYNAALAGAQGNEQDRQKFNIGEQDAATAARLGAVTNTAGLVNAQKINEQSLGLQRDAINAAGGKTNNEDKAINKTKAQAQKDIAAAQGKKNNPKKKK